MTNQFINKTDSDFTEQETKDILNHLMTEYLDNDSKNMKMSFDDMISATANDLGISKEQIRAAFSYPKAAKMIADLENSHTQVLLADRNLIEHLHKPFAFKKDLKFSHDEVREIMNHAKSNYFGKREFEVRKFEDTIEGLASDLGLTPKQVRAALSTVNKSTFTELEKTHNKRVKAHFDTLQFIETVGYPKIIRVLRLTSIWKLLVKREK
ncbi:MAG: hypothetical protein ABI091_13385 [Ferruginibacter sp.]